MSNIPDISIEYNKLHNNNSLNYSLFLMSSPLLGLKMLNEHPFEINELSDNGVSLLAQKILHKQYEKVSIPLWNEFASKGWGQVNITTYNVSQYLLAAMIYNGADPWVEWNITNSKESVSINTNSFFSLMCMQENIPMLELLFSHPNCPSVQYLEKMLIKQHMKSECNSQGEQNVNPLHCVVNAIKRDQDIALLELLISKGFDVNILDENKRSPLFYAMLPSVVDLLVKKGANVHCLDVSNNNVKQFWEKTISTAGKRSEMASIVTEKMKESMDIAQLQEIMKPELFNQVLSSTKQMFMASYRKGKFKPDVTFKGLNLMTAALLRNDNDKNNVFISTFEGQKNEHLWDFKILGSQTVSNLELSQICSDFQYKSSMRESLWSKKYKDTDPTDALMETVSLLVNNNLVLKAVLRFLQTSHVIQNADRVSYSSQYLVTNSVCSQVNVFKNKNALEIIKQFVFKSLSNAKSNVKIMDYDYHSSSNENFFMEYLKQGEQQNVCVAPSVVLLTVALLNNRSETWKSNLFTRSVEKMIEQIRKEEISVKDRSDFLEHLEKLEISGLATPLRNSLDDVCVLLNKMALMETIQDEWSSSQNNKKRKM